MESEDRTVAFVDLAGFSAITDIFGDDRAVAMLDRFEGRVAAAIADPAYRVKWIGDEVMLAFPDPGVAIRTLGRLIVSCRDDAELPLTRTALHHGPVIRRQGDLFGSTVNVAARIAALAEPGQMLATGAAADAASAEGVFVVALGEVSLRSIPHPFSLFEIQIAPAADPAWIDPVCKMLAPYAAFRHRSDGGPWFCSERCREAYHRSPGTYAAQV